MKEAIVHIHGHESLPRLEATNRFLKGITDYQTIAKVKEIDGDALSLDTRSLSVQYKSGDQREIDLYDAYWLDLAPSLTDQSAGSKFWGGFMLLFFWLRLSVLKIAFSSKWMFTGILVSMILIFVWYYGVIITFLDVVSNTVPAQASFAALPLWLKDWCKFIWTEIPQLMKDWRVWLTISFMVGLLPKRWIGIVDISHFSRCFLADQGLRLRIRSRLASIIEPIVESDKYDRVTIVAHSFGCALITDFLGEYKKYGEASLRIFTLGGPLGVLMRRSNWLGTELKRAQDNEAVEQWIDFHSKRDYLCNATPVLTAKSNFKSEEISDEHINLRSAMGENHKLYFQKQVINEEILS